VNNEQRKNWEDYRGEERAFRAGRTGTLHHILQLKGGKEGKAAGP